MGSAVTIRKARLKDAAGIAAVAESVRYQRGAADGAQGYLVYVGKPEDYLGRLKDDYLCFVAEKDGEVVGFVMASGWKRNTATHVEAAAVEERIFGEETLLVDQIGVKPEARGLGIAPALFEKVKRVATQGVSTRRMTASIMHGPVRNERSIGFFAGRQGFRCVGEYHDGSGFLWGIYEWKEDGTQGDERYPLGRFLYSDTRTEADAAARVERLRQMPRQLREVVKQFGRKELDQPIRPGAWTVRQIVHHLADGNAMIAYRTRWILTEKAPKLPGFDENRWVELPDAMHAPVEPSLRILDGVQARLADLLAELPLAALERTMKHSEQGVVMLDRMLDYLDWHGRHHVAQLKAALTSRA